MLFKSKIVIVVVFINTLKHKRQKKNNANLRSSEFVGA